MTQGHSTTRTLCVLAGYLASAGIAACLGGYFTAKVTITTLYATLAKPAWAPPGWLFGPVWTLLYCSMSLAMWLVWRRRQVWPAAVFARAHAAWWGQLACNAAWPVVFWLHPAGAAACMVCALLLACILLCIARFWPLSRLAAVLMLPYAAWVGFATALSWGLWRLNSAA